MSLKTFSIFTKVHCKTMFLLVNDTIPESDNHLCFRKNLLEII